MSFVSLHSLSLTHTQTHTLKYIVTHEDSHNLMKQIQDPSKTANNFRKCSDQVDDVQQKDRMSIQFVLDIDFLSFSLIGLLVRF